ncbi:MAG: M81 family metallopeptidase [Chloroflexota bacterium]|nr:M81 family metallopeptidase [Chloroflexota bacterium]MDE2947611.1 M81 family metallopeptidase [Chloroflexota bacterium]
MRIAVGGIMHESNTFNHRPTPLEAFRVQRGVELLSWWRDSPHEMAGFIAGAQRFGCEVFPTLMAQATPGGVVTGDAFERLTQELLERLSLAPPLDGLLLALHGAMVSEAHSDADGELLRRLRAQFGPDFPLVVTHDFHANISEQVVELSTALIIYKSYPHLDHRERGLQAASVIARAIKGEIRPVQALVKPAMLLNIVRQNTNLPPMVGVMAAARALEQEPAVLAASVAGGYQYADVPELGPAAVVVTDGAPALARQAAGLLADHLWAIRERLHFKLPDVPQAVRQARASERWPVILVDMGDNIGGGSSGDSTFILHELLRQGLTGWVVVLADPEAASACARAGVGAALRLHVGGKRDSLHGEPAEVSGRVKCLHDGRYEESEVRHDGQRYHDQGLSALLEIDGPPAEPASFLLLTSRRQTPFSLGQLLSVGLQPARQRALVVKAAIAWRAAYEAIAGEIIEVDSPGVTAVNPARFRYHRAPALWGLPASADAEESQYDKPH